MHVILEQRSFKIIMNHKIKRCKIYNPTRPTTSNRYIRSCWYECLAQREFCDYFVTQSAKFSRRGRVSFYTIKKPIGARAVPATDAQPSLIIRCSSFFGSAKCRRLLLCNLRANQYQNSTQIDKAPNDWFHSYRAKSYTCVQTNLEEKENNNISKRRNSSLSFFSFVR